MENFCLTEEEKMIKQEKNHLESMEGMSNILAAAHAGMVDLDLSVAGLMDMGEGLKGLGMGKLKGGRGQGETDRGFRGLT